MIVLKNSNYNLQENLRTQNTVNQTGMISTINTSIQAQSIHFLIFARPLDFI